MLNTGIHGVWGERRCRTEFGMQLSEDKHLRTSYIKQECHNLNLTWESKLEIMHVTDSWCYGEKVAKNPGLA